MRIAFLGKGGSGKTTLSSLATRLAPELFTEIYAIDADINLHLAGALGRTHDQASALTPIYKYVEAAIRQAPAYSIGMSNFVRRLERGEPLATSDIEPTTAATVRQLLSTVAAHSRDDAAMRAAAVKAHIRAAQNWPKAKFPIDLLSLLPPQERPGA